MMRNKLAVSVVIGCLLASCDWAEKVLCGQPTGKHKAYIDRMNRQHSGKLIIQQVPCYPGYLQVNCNRAVSDQLLEEIEASARQLDWIEVLVYDNGNRLIRGDTSSM